MNIIQLLSFIVSHPLNQGAKAAAVGRFVRWQAASRIIGKPIAMPFVESTRLLMERGMTGATGNWYCGLHEPDDMAFVMHALRPTDLFADVGANVGSYSILAGGAVGADVVSVEPLPSTYRRLLDNILINNLESKVHAYCSGLSDAEGNLTFTSDLDTMNRIATADYTGMVENVPVTTLDILFKDRAPAIIKIDVEGHELPVLKGGVNLFESGLVQAVLMETNGSGELYGVSDSDIIGALKKFGYSACHYNWQIRELTPADRGASNTIFVRDIDKMNAICRSAPKYKLVNGVV